MFRHFKLNHSLKWIKHSAGDRCRCPSGILESNCYAHGMLCTPYKPRSFYLHYTTPVEGGGSINDLEPGVQLLTLHQL